jgi:transposase-like protein
MSGDPTSEPDTVPESSAFLGWTWNAARYRAAAQIADGTFKDSDIAKQAGITARQLRKWKKQPEFAALVHAITSDATSAIRDEIVASKAGRLRVLVDLHNKLLAIIEARMAVHADERVWAAGESTGLIVTKESWGNTDSREAQADLGLVKQIQSLHEQIIKEQNNWDTKLNVRHSGRVDHVHRSIPHTNLSVDQLEALETIAADAYEREHAV